MRRFLLAPTLILAGCASSPTPRTWLDPYTAATITAQAEPIVLARDEQLRAINVRDYVQLGAVEVNRMGQRDLYLVVILWSTIDRSAAEPERLSEAFARLEVQADDRPFALVRAASTPPGIGQRPFRLPAPEARQMYFPVGREELQAIATSRSLSATPRGSSEESRYTEWRDGRASLQAFLAALPR